MLLYIIIGIVCFGLLIAVHEGGHFLTAKLLGVQVNEFSIGMGPALFSKRKGETLYSLRVFPMGGYCAMEGEDQADENNPRAFGNKAPWRRILILAAGSAANLIAGFLLVVILFTWVGGYAAPVIDGFMDGFPLEGESGLMVGDRFLEINGEKIHLYTDAQTALSNASGQGSMDIVVERAGETITLTDLPLAPREYVVEGETVTMYGIYFGREDATAFGILSQSWYTCGYFAKAVWSGLAMLVGGQVGLADMSGPVGIVSYLGEAGSQGGSVAGGIQNVLYVIALIAVNLAIMNLLPIPALDGGRIFLLLVTEIWFLLTHRRPDPKYEAYLHAAGFALLIGLMLVITFSDVWKLFT